MKKRILFLAANPTTETWLALDEECRAIETEIRASKHRDSLELLTKWAVRPNELLQHFHEHSPTVVHFSGHGTRSGGIVLVGKNRKSKTVSAAALRFLFATLRSNVRVVVLNACFSETQAKALQKVVDCCIGMNNAVRDDAAIAFAAAFYRAIAFGLSVKEAFDCGIVALGVEGIPGKQTPRLLWRDGVNPAKVFVLKSQNDKPSQRFRASTSPSRRDSLPPRLVAKFQEVNGALCRNTEGRCPEYGIDLWIENAPVETKAAHFEILDDGVRGGKWSLNRERVAKTAREFLTDDVSLYGDVEIWVRGSGKLAGIWVIQSTLYEALSRYYDQRSRTKEIQRALKQIRDY